MNHHEIAERDEHALSQAKHLLEEFVRMASASPDGKDSAGRLTAALQCAFRAAIDWGAGRMGQDVKPADLAEWSTSARRVTQELQALVDRLGPQTIRGFAGSLSIKVDSHGGVHHVKRDLHQRRTDQLHQSGYVGDHGPRLHHSDEVFLPKHADDYAVDSTARAMKVKLAEKRAQGRGGWDNKAECSQERLSQMLRQHVEKGDPLDVANFAMMLFQRGERIL